MYCVYCGNQIPDDSDFCTHCGKPLTQQSTNTTVKSKSRRVPKIVKIIVIIVVICLFIGITANVIGRMVLHSQLSHTWITYSKVSHSSCCLFSLYSGPASGCAPRCTSAIWINLILRLLPGPASDGYSLSGQGLLNHKRAPHLKCHALLCIGVLCLKRCSARF